MDVWTVAMIGAGVMGAGIAQVRARGGYAVHLYDAQEDALTRAVDRTEHGKYGLRRGVAIGKATETDFTAAVTDVDFVIEAVPEDLALKVRVFRQLDALAPPHAILASNTSGFPIGGLAATMVSGQRTAGSGAAARRLKLARLWPLWTCLECSISLSFTRLPSARICVTQTVRSAYSNRYRIVPVVGEGRALM